MSNVLVIVSSPRADSYSTRAARELSQRLAPGSTITVRDLNKNPMPHIDDAFAVARTRAPEELTADQRATLRLSDALIEELFMADVIIIASAMINFGVSSNLKAYVDHIVRPRVTFRYNEPRRRRRRLQTRWRKSRCWRRETATLANRVSALHV